MPTLYAITDEMMRLNDLLDDIDGDPSRLGEGEAAMLAFIEQLEHDQAAKLDGYIHLVKQLRMEAAAAKAEKEQWQAKEKARTARADYLELRLLRHLEATGQHKVTTASGRVVSVQRNGGVQPLEIKPGTDPAAIPAEYVRTVVEIDRPAVRKALEAGAELAFAELLPRGVSLRVK